MMCANLGGCAAVCFHRTDEPIQEAQSTGNGLRVRWRKPRIRNHERRYQLSGQGSRCRMDVPHPRLHPVGSVDASLLLPPTEKETGQQEFAPATVVCIDLAGSENLPSVSLTISGIASNNPVFSCLSAALSSLASLFSFRLTSSPSSLDRWDTPRRLELSSLLLGTWRLLLVVSSLAGWLTQCWAPLRASQSACSSWPSARWLSGPCRHRSASFPSTLSSTALAAARSSA